MSIWPTNTGLYHELLLETALSRIQGCAGHVCRVHLMCRRRGWSSPCVYSLLLGASGTQYYPRPLLTVLGGLSLRIWMVRQQGVGGVHHEGDCKAMQAVQVQLEVCNDTMHLEHANPLYRTENGPLNGQ